MPVLAEPGGTPGSTERQGFYLPILSIRQSIGQWYGMDWRRINIEIHGRRINQGTPEHILPRIEITSILTSWTRNQDLH